MWKTLKETIRGKPSGDMKTVNINFECLDNTEEGNVADNFNLFYIQSIDNIMQSINEIPEDSKGDANADNEDK